MFNLLIALLLSAGVFAGVEKNIVPDHWYALPEEGGLEFNELVQSKESKKQEEMLTSLVDRIVSAEGDALDGLAALPTAGTSDPRHPKDWTPWHTEFFMTDMAISTSGLLGILTWKGTPSVSVIWRRQYEKAKPALPEQPKSEPALSAINIASDSTAGDIAAQLEPAIRAVMADGKVQDESALRTNLVAAAKDFQAVVSGLEKDQGLQWWASRFRMDVSVDVSGKIYNVVTVGAETKFRFDWNRIQRKTANTLPQRDLSGKTLKLKSNLEEFVLQTARDLDAISENNSLGADGFKMHQFRVGVGVSAKGDIGIVKGSIAVLGQLYFARDVKKPNVNPKPKPELAGTLNIIEDAPSKGHLNYASENGISFDSSADQVVYHVDRAKFRKGIERALKMGGFFATRAARSKSRRWKVFELKSGFDLSISGGLGLATLVGNATVEMAFYNEKF